MSPVLTPAPSTEIESLILDGLALNDHIDFSVEAVDLTPPAKRLLWQPAKDGDALGDEAGYERRTITVRIRPRVDGTMDAALAKLGQITDKLQKAERADGGVALIWTPGGSLFTLTAYVLSGEVTRMPLEMSGPDAGWVQHRPVVEIRLDCKPFLYGDEVTEAVVTNTDPMQIATIEDVAGDVPAEARIIVSDNASKSRDHVEVGLHTGDSDQTSTDLILDSSSFTVSGFSGTSTTRSGSYGANVLRGTASPNWLALCSTGDETHVGIYRVKARVYASTDDASVRLAWRAGDTPHSRNGATQIPIAAKWMEVDLGSVYLPEVELGAQRWEGRVEFKAETSGATVDVDTVFLVPAERYGLARHPAASLDFTPTSYAAADEFDQAAGALTGKTARLGGNWSGAGDSDDFSVVATVPFVEDSHAARTAVSDADVFSGRFATLGSAVAACGVQADVNWSASADNATGVLARYVDTDNWMALTMGYGELFIQIVVGGAPVDEKHTPSALFRANNYWFRGLHLTIDAAGNWAAALGGVQVRSGQIDDLATGGALATGKVGIYDAQPSATANTRKVDNFAAWTPEADHAVWSGQSIEFRHDDTLRENSAGTIYGRPPSYRGSRFFIPQAGDEGKITRVAAKARRNDVADFPDTSIADSTSLTVLYTPRFLTVPR